MGCLGSRPRLSVWRRKVCALSGNFYLDWATATVSLLNTILMLWLGLTILLNAEHRSWGVWVAGGGLLMGGTFFFSHSAILGHGLDYLGQGIDFWWRIGWTLVITLPFLWYVIILWYAGFWEDAAGDVPVPASRRRRLWMIGLLAAGLVILLILAHTLPSFDQIANTRTSSVITFGNLPLMALLYPLYIVLCIGLSLEALLRPEPSDRAMGDLARRRARPWLAGTSVVLLVVSMMVAWVMVWTLMNIGQRSLPGFFSNTTIILARFDLLISGLIALAAILLGQAIVSYEVFTGKALPRRGFRRYWHRAIVLAAGYGTLVGWSLTIQLRPAYSFLLTTLLVVGFYALLSWRSFAERERTIAQLRPFVVSQQLYENLLGSPSAAPAGLDVETPFRALCEDVLGARMAYLTALGSLSVLFGSPLAYPKVAVESLPDLDDITGQFHSPHEICSPVDPARYGGATWAVPLWSERGLIGVLMLGEKRDGGLYAQEEIEIARAIGERLIDTQASAEMARRLMDLQRRQLAESQVLDRQTRRSLHDDVLPQIHAALLNLGQTQANPEVPISETIGLLTQTHRQISELLRGMPVAATAEIGRTGLVGALRKAVENELKQAFDDISWDIEPQAERKAATIPPLTAEVFFYAGREAVRNAALHGRDGRSGKLLALRISVLWREGLVLQIEDDGMGISPEVRSKAHSGRGLALHSTMVALVGGNLDIESEPGVYTRVRLTLPEA